MNGNYFTLLTAMIALLIVGMACGQLPNLQTQQAPPAATPAPPANAATPDQTSERLLEKIEELERKIDEQKQPQPSPSPAPSRQTRRVGSAAWVDAPGDGFLALRSMPSADDGQRLLRIPHGAEVRVLDCQTATQRIGGRTGRWCRVSYGGTTGWAFDGWLVY